MNLQAHVFIFYLFCSAWVGGGTFAAYPDTGTGVNQRGQGKW